MCVCVCRVLFGNYIGCITSILNLPKCNRLFSSKSAPVATSQQTHCARCVWFFSPSLHYSTPAYSTSEKNHYLGPEDIQPELKRSHTKGCFSSGVPDPVVIFLICIYASVSPENRWGTHSQVSYLGSSGVPPAHSLHPLVVLVSSSHHITICPPYEVNICFYFYPSLSLTPINVLRLLISLLSHSIHLGRRHHTASSPVPSYSLLICYS